MEALAPHSAIERAEALLLPAQKAAFQRLLRELQAHQHRWGLFLLQYEHADEQDAVVAALGVLNDRLAKVVADNAEHQDWTSLEADIVQSARNADLVQVTKLDRWLDPHDAQGRAEPRLRAWNVRREAFARDVSVPVLCWVRPATLQLIAEYAPDLWHWRAGVHRFGREAGTEHNSGSVAPSAEPWIGSIDNRDAELRRSRISEIKKYLKSAQITKTPDELALKASLLNEMAVLLESLGDAEGALDVQIQELVPLLQQTGDVRAAAVAQARVSGLLAILGKYNEAVNLLTNQALPTLRRLGDQREIAIALGRLADVHQQRDDLDEAMRIRIEEQLPVFRRLNDKWEIAITIGQVADIHAARGDLDEALGIRLNEELPIFERLGDRRLIAYTHLKIADILAAMGRLDDAISRYRTKALPVFEQLGDLRARTAALGRIADVLMARGDLDEALAIYEQDQLPTARRLGDVRGEMVIMGKIAKVLETKGFPRRALDLHTDRLVIARRLGIKESTAHALYERARLRRQVDSASPESRQEIRRDLAEALAIGQAIGIPKVICYCGLELVEVLLELGEIDEASAILRQVDIAARKVTDSDVARRLETLQRQVAHAS